MTELERYRGAMLGLAAGDALGVTLEFCPPGTFTPIDDMRGGGPFGLEAGQWTDDTSMALCLAESLVECRGFDPVDQLRRYVCWYRDGHLSSTGRCFDIGRTVLAALTKFEATGEPWCGATDRRSSGNGSLMRLAPVALYFATDPAAAVEHAASSSRTTHASSEAVDACRYLAGLIVGAVHGRRKDELLGPAFAPVDGLWQRQPLDAAIADVAAGSFLQREPPRIAGTGHVVCSLEAALWAFAKSASFEEGALLAVNLGNDADTTGAVHGQLAGAYYGAESIPARWLARLAMRETIERFADGLMRRGS